MFRNIFDGSLVGVGGVPRWIDRLVIGGLVLLIVYTPFALGAVHRCSFVLAETVVFALVWLWMVKLWLGTSGPVPAWPDLSACRRLGAPIVALLGLILGQLAPLPAPMLRASSPRTYSIYRLSLPGWPSGPSYRALSAVWNVRPVGEVGSSPNPRGRRENIASGANGSRSSAAFSQNMILWRWRSLSLAPTVTASGLLEASALAALFFLILAYPFELAGEGEPEPPFMRTIILAMTATAVAVAIVGLVERGWWNGRILWFYRPHDWPGPWLTGGSRARGPFVDPDHFANYLTMTLPLSVVGAIFAVGLRRRTRAVGRAIWAGAAVLVATAVVLSLSRAGWIAAGLAVCGAVALSFHFARERAPEFVRRLSLRALPMAFAGFAILLIAALYLIGPSARTEVGNRLALSVMGQSLQNRPGNSEDTIHMIAEFPLFGIGLGCWPELFPHYQRPTWLPVFFREAENDYLQFVAETGFSGLCLLAWFAYLVMRRLWRAARFLSPAQWPLYAGLLAGIGATLLHEAFDFSLHIPANAILFTMLLALAQRIALMEKPVSRTPRVRRAERHALRRRLGPAGVAAASTVLIVAVQLQNGDAYPYATKKSISLSQAEAEVLAHPAVSAAHLTVAAMMPPGVSAQIRTDQLYAAVVLDPNDPRARDLYASVLLRAGKRSEGLRQITLSVYHAPRLELHPYLSSELIPWLLPDEQTAVASGFEHAVDESFDQALDQCAIFYADLGRYRDASEIYVRAGRRALGEAQKVVFEVKAGHYYALAGDFDQASRILREAREIALEDAAPYEEQVKSVLGPAGDFTLAQSTVDEGLRRGADPYLLEHTLARTAGNAGNLELYEKALRRAIDYEPTFEDTMELGEFYLTHNRFDRAILTLQRATEIKPDSAVAYSDLGRAREAAYDYSGAARAYAQATALAPRVEEYRRIYQAFEQRTAEAAETSQPASASAQSPDSP